MGRFIVIVLDGFGIGAMEDVSQVRKNDIGADTFGHIFNQYPRIAIPHLRQLGLLLAHGTQEHTYKVVGNYGRMKLAHYGADTFFGHQELMGSAPNCPACMKMCDAIDRIQMSLNQAGYNVKRSTTSPAFLIVNEAVIVADNIECDLGSAINVSAALDLISFEEVQRIGHLVRMVVTLPRVIAFGGRGIALANLLEAVQIKGEYVGVNAPKSGVYKNDYHCIHLGYGVNTKVQVPSTLAQKKIPTYLVGKVADIVVNPLGESYSIVNTDKVLHQVIDLMEKVEEGFICANVQETDLAGHSEDVKRYKDVLEIADRYIGLIQNKLDASDRLVIMADHGNDPTIGHSKHTRENVPLLYYYPTLEGGNRIQERQTLADVGASVIKYFQCEAYYVGAGKDFIG
ncbi:MAG: phosphopentomutase [Cellulosilyticaceae bacterium]